MTNFAHNRKWYGIYFCSQKLKTTPQKSFNLLISAAGAWLRDIKLISYSIDF